jgi:hypothetical protein
VKIPFHYRENVKFSQILTKFSQMFKMFSQILRNFREFSQLFAKFSLLFAKFSKMFTLFRFFLESVYILAHFLLEKISPNFYGSHYYSWKILKICFSTYPQQLWVRRIGKRTHFIIKSPWMYISAECLLKLIYNFYMCADDF